MTHPRRTAFLKTKRLRLEPLRIFHAASMVKVLADPELYTFTGGEPPTFEQLKRRYAMLYAGSRTETEEWHNWIVREVESFEPVGTVQATVYGVVGDIAWTTGPSWQNRGYASEAAAAVAEWLTSQRVSTLTGWIHPDHTASQAVAKKLGMSLTDEVDEDGEQAWRVG